MTRVAMLEALNYGLGHLAAAAARMGVELHLLTFDEPYYRQDLRGAPSIRVHDVDTASIDAVQAALTALDIGALVSNTDRWAPVAEQVADQLGLPGILTGTRTILDKGAVRERLYAAGLARHGAVYAPAARAQDGAVAGVEDGPVIVKDARGSGSRDVVFATNPAEVLNQVDELERRGVPPERVVIETYARGPMFSAETWTTEERAHLLGVSSRLVSDMPVWIELDSTYPVRRGTPWEREVSTWVARVLDLIDRGPGPSHVEFIDTGAGFELVEVNARLGGGLHGASILEASGVDVFALLLHQALGNSSEAVLAAETRPAPFGGYTQVIKYADRLGPLGPVSGVEVLRTFPGRPQWHPSRPPEYVVTDLTHQAAAYGTVSAVGEDPEEALFRAHAASRHLVLAGRGGTP